jgi:hypothetical protein
MGGLLGKLGKLASDFVIDAVRKIIFYLFGIIYGSILEAIRGVLAVIIDSFSSLDKYVDYASIVSIFRLMCPGIIIVCIVYRVQKDKSSFELNDYSFFMYVKSVIIAVGGIYFLPWFLENVILYGTNVIAKAINYSDGTFYDSLTQLTNNFSFTDMDLFFTCLVVALLLIVLAIGVLVIAFTSAFRYLELVFINIATPFISSFGVLDPSLYKVWFLESFIAAMSIVINVVILKLLSSFFIKLNVILVSTDDLILKSGEEILGVMVGIAFIVLSVKGASILKKYAYKSGIGEAATGVGGSLVRMAAMAKFMV